MLFEAIEFATHAHKGQYRKGTRFPFIIHPLAVARILIGYNYSQDIVVSGVLHDTLENTPVTLEEIRASFGKRVAGLVMSVTEKDRKRPWEVRKLNMLAELEHATLDVLILECADKLDNLRETLSEQQYLGEAVWNRFNRPKHYQNWYYSSLAKLLSERIRREPDRSLYNEFERELSQLFGGTEVPIILELEVWRQGLESSVND